MKPQKIVDNAEEKAEEYYGKVEKNPDSRSEFVPDTYINAKKLNFPEGRETDVDLYHQIHVNYDHHFGTKVNTSFSSIHVPTSIYERSKYMYSACIQLSHSHKIVLLYNAFDNHFRGRRNRIHWLVK